MDFAPHDFLLSCSLNVSRYLVYTRRLSYFIITHYIIHIPTAPMPSSRHSSCSNPCHTPLGAPPPSRSSPLYNTSISLVSHLHRPRTQVLFGPHSIVFLFIHTVVNLPTFLPFHFTPPPPFIQLRFRCSSPPILLFSPYRNFFHFFFIWHQKLIHSPPLVLPITGNNHEVMLAWRSLHAVSYVVLHFLMETSIDGELLYT